MARSKLVCRYRNRLLAALSPDDLALLEPHFSPAVFDRFKPLEHPNRKIDALYFVEHGIVSVVAANGSNTQSEVGIIGCEGMTGVAVILQADRSPHSTYVQVAGEGQRIGAAAVMSAMERSRSLQSVLHRYAHTFLIQAAHTAVANAKASIEERLARWLLMAHDRTDGDEVNLTHDLLALMLGTRRPGVTDAIGNLARNGFIRPHRGQILIADRDGLMERAGEFYGVPEAEYDRLIG